MHLRLAASALLLAALPGCGGEDDPFAEAPTTAEPSSSSAPAPSSEPATPPPSLPASTPAAEPSPTGSPSSVPIDPRAPVVVYERSGGLVAQTRRVVILGDGTVEVTSSGAVATATASPRPLSTKEVGDLVEALEDAEVPNANLRQGDGCCDRRTLALTFRGATVRAYDALPGRTGRLATLIERYASR